MEAVRLSQGRYPPRRGTCQLLRAGAEPHIRDRSCGSGRSRSDVAGNGSQCDIQPPIGRWFLPNHIPLQSDPRFRFGLAPEPRSYTGGSYLRLAVKVDETWSVSGA